MNKNYISAEQFLSQSEKVQKVLLDWWKPQIGERIYSIGISFGEYILLNYHKTNAYHVMHLESHNISITAKNVFIPLLTETQLRHFVEQKICDGKLTTEYYVDGYKIFILDPNYDEKPLNDFDTNQVDLLEAYWEVVCNIAETLKS